MRVVITGCSRPNGIGLELCRQLAERGDLIEATTRKPSGALDAFVASYPGRVRAHILDVASDESARTLTTQIREPVDVIINNAGVWEGARDLTNIDTARMLEVYSINALGAMRVTSALLTNLRAGTEKKVLNLSTGMAILGEPNDGRGYAYRMSKVALNMMTRTMAANLRVEHVKLCVIDPGWVQTDMGGDGAQVPVGDSVRGLIAWLDRMTEADSGDFLHYSGHKLPW